MALITVRPTALDVAIANAIAAHTTEPAEQVSEALTWGAAIGGASIGRVSERMARRVGHAREAPRQRLVRMRQLGQPPKRAQLLRHAAARDRDRDAVPARLERADARPEMEGRIGEPLEPLRHDGDQLVLLALHDERIVGFVHQDGVIELRGCGVVILLIVGDDRAGEQAISLMVMGRR